MARERRGDVLYRHHVNKSSLVQAKVAESKFGGPPPRKMQVNSNAPVTFAISRMSEQDDEATEN
jgi:hypothetical protein